ncbi:MAG: hypothetical protein ACODAU_08885 [Myxococcota bacterium]
MVVPLVASTLAFGLAATAGATTVRGTLEVRGKIANPGNEDLGAPLKPYWEEWNGFLEVRRADANPARALSVVLVGKAAGPPVGCDHALRDGDLAPTTMVGAKGTTLRIENTDGCAHELYADGIDAFGPLQTAPGNARTVPLGETGHFVVRDRLYPHVVGHLHVVENLVACAEVDEKGRYRFTDVPEGDHTLQVYRGDAKVASQPVEASGRVVTLGPIRVPTGDE